MRAEGFRRARATCSSRLVNAGRKTEQASDWVYRSLERPSGHSAVTLKFAICQARDARLSSTFLLAKQSRPLQSASSCRRSGILRCFVRRRTIEREAEARRGTMDMMLDLRLERDRPRRAC